MRCGAVASRSRHAVVSAADFCLAMKDSFILSDDDSSEFPTMPTMRGGDPSTLGRIDHYDVLRKLGGGGFGVVYLARDSASGLEVALKTLHPLLKNNPEEMDNLREKFALASRLSHPNIATALVLHPCRDVDVWDESARGEMKLSAGDSVMVMRYAPGVTLSRWRRQFEGGAAPPGQALEIVRQIASALDYAHGEKIVHRDVKPGNIMVETRDDGTVRARLLDFGLAAEIRSSMSRISSESGDTSGTRPYMAPEQWQGQPQDGRTDQYALACVLYELLSGEPPLAGVFETGDPMMMRASVLSESPSPVSGITAAANAALARALSKRPSERFPSCTAFVDAMERAVTALLSPGEASHPGELQGEGGFQTAVNDQTIQRRSPRRRVRRGPSRRARDKRARRGAGRQSQGGRHPAGARGRQPDSRARDGQRTRRRPALGGRSVLGDDKRWRRKDGGLRTLLLVGGHRRLSPLRQRLGHERRIEPELFVF